MKKIVFMFTLLVTTVGAEAKYWKIGPGSVAGMDFASINAAMSSSNVTKGDTLYLDQYYNENSDQTVTKQVVIIGTGYDTSLSDEHVVARLTSTLHLKANGIVVKSVLLGIVYFYNEECTVERCYMTSGKTQSTTAGINHIYSCYVVGTISGYGSSNYSKYDIQNCVIIYSDGSHTICYLTSSIIRFNTIIRHYYSSSYYCMSSITNSNITNNIILSYYDSYYNNDINSGVYSSGSGNSIEHNLLSHKTSLSYYPTNKYGYGSKFSELFVLTGSYSDYYKLAEKSAALEYATDGGEVGCHGGMFGCPSGGRPQYIPYFTKVTVGSRSEEGKLPVSVTIKIQDE